MIAPATPGAGRARATPWDCVVVGAGPGGAVAARELARRGLSVLLADRVAFPRWKVCGACLSPGAVATLEAAGLRPRVEAAGPVPLHRVALFAPARRAEVALRGSLALSRATLDRTLVDAAVEAGARFAPRTRVRLLGLGQGVRLLEASGPDGTRTVAARVVIDASGLVGLSGSRGGERPSSVAPGSRVGLGATLDAPDEGPEAGELRMVVAPRGYVGLVRLEDGRLNVAAAVDADVVRRAGPAEAVAGLLRAAGHRPLAGRAVHGWRGTPPLTRRAADPGGERLLRLGDAAGYVEPFTGEGMCWALDSAVAAADLLARGPTRWRPGLLSAWRAHHERLRRAQLLCRTLAWGLRRPALVSGALGVLAHAPGLAAPLVRRAGARPTPSSTGPS